MSSLQIISLLFTLSFVSENLCLESKKHDMGGAAVKKQLLRYVIVKINTVPFKSYVLEMYKVC